MQIIIIRTPTCRLEYLPLEEINVVLSMEAAHVMPAGTVRPVDLQQKVILQYSGWSLRIEDTLSLSLIERSYLSQRPIYKEVVHFSRPL